MKIIANDTVHTLTSIQIPTGFGRMPEEIKNDVYLDAPSLIVLAFRCMFAGKRKLRRKTVNQYLKDGSTPTTGRSPAQRHGIDKNAFRTAIANCIHLGYMEDVDLDGDWIVSLTFRQPRSVPQFPALWFLRGLPLNALATLIWLDVNPGSCAWDVARRFGWSSRTAITALSELVAHDLVVTEEQSRDHRTRFSDQPYRVSAFAASKCGSTGGQAGQDADLTEYAPC